MKLLFVLFYLLFIIFTGHHCQDGKDNIIDADGSLNVGQTVGNEKMNISEYRLHIRETPEKKSYGVYDGLISAKDHYLLKSFLSCDNTDWLFNNYDSEDENKQRSHDNTAWINNQDPLAFSKTKLSEKILQAVKDVSKQDGAYYPYKVFAKILRRGDSTKVAKDSDDVNEFSAMIFMNEYWRKNYYGELYFYDDNKEIVGGTTHKSARLVVWQSDMYRLNRPPAVQFLQGQVLFHVQYTKNESKMMTGHKAFTDFKEKRDEAHEKWNIPNYEIPNGGINNLDIEKHKKFEYTTEDGRKIFVFDNLFPDDLLDHMRKFVLEYGTYFYDDSIDSDSDNVQWVAGFLLDPYVKSPYWKIIQKAAHESTGNKELFPYDISINLIRNADFTRIHKDVSYFGEEEYTCLVYLNPNWKKNYYGETTFFERDGEGAEIAAQVKPKYGRLVIFDGNIPHSARPPSFNFTGARLTFVTKLHRNEYTGRRKNFQEELRFFRSIVGSNFEMNDFKGGKGEEKAKKIIEQSRKIHEQVAIPKAGTGEKGDVEDDDGEIDENDDEDEENRGENDRKDGGETLPKLDHEYTAEALQALKDGQRFIRREESPIIDAEDDETLDPVTTKIVNPVLDLTEETPNAVELLKKSHLKMVKKSLDLTTRYKKKVLETI